MLHGYQKSPEGGGIASSGCRPVEMMKHPPQSPEGGDICYTLPQSLHDNRVHIDFRITLMNVMSADGLFRPLRGLVVIIRFESPRPVALAIYSARLEL